MIKAKSKTTVKEFPGYAAFKKEMKKVSGSFVTIGIHEDAGTYDDGTSVVDVAAWNEFGTSTIPSRPFIRNVVYGKENQINSLRDRLLHKMLEGELTLKKALESMGFQIAVWIQNQISGRSPFQANKDSTILHKKYEGVTPPNKPLYETGLLMRSIGYQTTVSSQKSSVKKVDEGSGE